MATATIINVKDLQVRNIEEYSYSNISVEELQVKNIKINELLPFRVRITDVDLFGFNRNNVPAIPLQIIGFSNYIL